MKRELLYFTFFLLMCFTLPLTATAQGVDIPDPSLRAAVETALSKAEGKPIAPSEMATLTRLEAPEAGVRDLTGLEHATNLTVLKFDNNSISDISALANLTNLIALHLWRNSVKDLSPLAGLTKLTGLYLGENSASDLSPLAGLTNLESLFLDGNGISDLSPLVGLTNLTSLTLEANRISDLSPLVANTGLGSGDEVYLRGNPLSHTSIKTHIPTLQGRGVTVKFDDTTNLNVDEPRTVEFDNTKNLNVGEPHTVRLIYFLPSDRSPQRDIDTKLDTLIGDVQQFYADEMERHGFEGKTFTFETNVNGKAAVHHVDGQFTDSHYHQNTAHKVREEIQQQFYAPHRIYAVAIDISSERLCGEAKALPVDRSDKMFVMPASGHCFNLSLAAHELGHTFGLRHDFRNDVYTMSYGKRGRLSKCAAEWLDANRFFNSSQTSFNEPATIQILPPLAYSSNAIRLRFEVTDTDGLHQAQLIIPTTARDPVEGSSIKLHGCKSLRGENSSLEFITTELTVEPATEVILHVIDVYGGITRSRFTFTKDDILPDPTNRIPTTLEKISGDNQHGMSITPLPDPLVVKVIDQNGIAFEEIVVTFAVIAGDGTLSVTRTTTDENGRAQSTLTLGTNLGTNAVSVSAAGIEGTVTFNAVVEPAVDLPDLNLRAAVETALGKASGVTITAAEMATLTRLDAPEAGINNLTGLKHATNLTHLDLWKSSVSDISPVAGLTKLTHLGFAANNAISDVSALVGLTNLTALWVNGNSISDISPLAGLTKLSRLGLDNNNISDISALAGLTNLTLLKLNHNAILDLLPLAANTGLGSGDEIYVRGNPLSYTSIKTHIPTLQGRGIVVEFDDRTPQTIRRISGDAQVGLPGAPLANQFVVEVQDENRAAFEGVPITFTVTAGGGTLSVTSTTTDTNGRAESTFTLGPAPGTNTVTVAVTGIQEGQTFTAEGIGVPKTLEIISGKDQEGLPGTTLEKPFVVEVRDQTDKPLPGVEVTFTVTTGGGTVQPEIATTDENGRAESILTLGPNPGTNTVTVSVTGSQETRTFNAEGSRIPKKLEIISGADQEGLPGEVLEKPFVVEVRDADGSRLEGVVVTFAITAGGGTLSVTSTTTDANGRAESVLTLGPNPGTNTVTVSVTGSQETRTFNAEGSRIPKELEIISGADQEGLPGEVLEKPFVVEVRDQTDKPLPGVEVTFTVTAGGGTLRTTRATTNENGRAESTLTLGSTPGTNTVRVSVEGNSETVALLTIEAARMPMFTLSIPAGTHAIHIPLAVNQINGEDATIETVGDLYNALGDAVNYIITVGDDGGWKTYLGDISAGSAVDAAIEDDTGLIVVMSDAKTLELVGDALGAGGDSMINIDVGNNLVGLPLKPAAGPKMISGLLVDGVGAIAVSKADGMGFHTITAAGQEGDGPIMGGVGYLVVYTGMEATSIPIVGSPWDNSGAVSAAPAVVFDGTHTPVLYVEGGVMDEFNMLSRVLELRVTVKNLSTGASLDTVLGTETSATSYSGTFVELSRHAAKVGDVIEIAVHSPNPYVGVRPVPQIVVSAEEVLTYRISLPDVELYEIPSETELLANYPNPFNPETWIPYRLAKAAEVTLEIYHTNGSLVRTIDVGFKPAAGYESRASAIYWDGRNNQGESVASGVYFYHLSAGAYSTTRKMLIMK